MGQLATMGTAGDVRTIWDSNRPDEVAAARATFERLTGLGYLAFSVKGEKGQKDQRISAFDPEAERIILVPPVAGG